MFCNGLNTDEGDIVRLGPTTITGMTILKVLFVLDHDSGRYRWFGWARQICYIYVKKIVHQVDSGASLSIGPPNVVNMYLKAIFPLH